MKIALASCADLPGWEIDDAPLIESLKAKGVDVHQPAWTDEINWENFDATIIRTTWDYHHNIDAFLDWVGRVPRLFNNAEIIKWNANRIRRAGHTGGILLRCPGDDVFSFSIL